MTNVYFAVLAIINATEDDEPVIYHSLNKLTQFFSQHHSIEQQSLISLLSSPHFRNYVMFAMQCYWLDDENLVAAPENLITFHKHNSQSLKGSPLIRALNRIDENFVKTFTELDLNNLTAVYEQAYIQIDLSVCHVSLSPKVNALMMAGFCFQCASTLEPKRSHAAIAAERMSLLLYQRALSLSRRATPMVKLQTAVQIAKALSQFRYNHPKLILTKEQKAELLSEETSAEIFSPGDGKLKILNADVCETIEGAVASAFYLADLMPCFQLPCLHGDLLYAELMQLGLLKQILNFNLDQVCDEAASHHQRAKVLYHLYEGALFGWAEQYKKEEFRFQAISELLKAAGSSIEKMSHHLHYIHSTMQRDLDGFFTPQAELNLPDVPGNPVFQSVDGVEIDLATGKITLLLSPWTDGMPKHQRLITQYDLQQMLTSGIGHAWFSLDHPDCHKLYHPLQKMRFSPPTLQDTEFLKTMLYTDYLLKFFTTGHEVSGHPPYHHRPTQSLLSHLPKHLQDILTSHEYILPVEHGFIAKRFWIEANEIELYETTENDKLRIALGATKMKIKTHPLYFDATGKLVDEPLDGKEDSSAREFTEKFTTHYAEISEYFPEFARLAQFSRMGVLIKKLQAIRAVTLQEIEHLQTQIRVLEQASNHTNTQLKEQQQHLVKINKKRNNLYSTQKNKLTTVIKEASPFAYADCSHPDIGAAYLKLYNDNFDRIYAAQKNDIQKQRNDYLAQGGHLALLRYQSDEEIKRDVKQYIDEKLSLDSVFNQANREGKKRKEDLQKQLISAFSLLKPVLGNATFNVAINETLNGNPHRLAAAGADHAVSENKMTVENNIALLTSRSKEIQHELDEMATKLQRKQALNQSFINMNLGKVYQKEDLDQPHQELFVPSVNAHAPQTHYRIYGGVLSDPRIQRINNLISELSSGYTFVSPWYKQSDIDSARNYLTYMDLSSIGLGYPRESSELCYKRRELQDAIWRAESDLRMNSLRYDSPLLSPYPWSFNSFSPTFMHNNFNPTDHSPMSTTPLVDQAFEQVYTDLASSHSISIHNESNPNPSTASRAAQYHDAQQQQQQKNKHDHQVYQTIHRKAEVVNDLSLQEKIPEVEIHPPKFESPLEVAENNVAPPNSSSAIDQTAWVRQVQPDRAPVTASLTQSGLDLFKPMVSHTTKSAHFSPLVRGGIDLNQSAPRNLFGAKNAFYVAEGPFSAAEVVYPNTPKASILYTLEKKPKIYHMKLGEISTLRSTSGRAGIEHFVKDLVSQGYDTIRYQSLIRQEGHYNLALLTDPNTRLKPIGIYPHNEKYNRTSRPELKKIKSNHGLVTMSPKTIRASQALGLAGTACAIAHAGHEIYHSDNRPVETLHQGSLFTAAAVGGSIGAKMALEPCGVVGGLMPAAAWLTVPTCIAAGGLIGGFAAVTATDTVWLNTVPAALDFEARESMLVEPRAHEVIYDMDGFEWSPPRYRVDPSQSREELNTLMENYVKPTAKEVWHFLFPHSQKRVIRDELKQDSTRGVGENRSSFFRSVPPSNESREELLKPIYDVNNF